MFNPPLSVTLNLPSLGLITATKVGRKMYQARTDSYTSAQNECLNSPLHAGVGQVGVQQVRQCVSRNGGGTGLNHL